MLYSLFSSFIMPRKMREETEFYSESELYPEISIVYVTFLLSQSTILWCENVWLTFAVFFISFHIKNLVHLYIHCICCNIFKNNIVISCRLIRRFISHNIFIYPLTSLILFINLFVLTLIYKIYNFQCVLLAGEIQTSENSYSFV